MDSNNLINGFLTSSIDYNYESKKSYRHEFVSNDVKHGKKVLTTIEEELKNCEEFILSVAFITEGGIAPLLQTLKDLEEKDVPGRILTTDYLTFSEPKALRKLAGLKNIELKMYQTDKETDGFHTKGYIFRNDETYRIIIGSSNMTLKAITKNKEWNTKFVSTKDGMIVRDIMSEFEELWNDKHAISFENFIDRYSEEFEQKKKAREEIKENPVDYKDFTPNKMQLAFIDNLVKMREQNINKAMLISATGTGKTYASAFAMQKLQPRKILFVVHREQILKQAKRSFYRVFKNSKTYGLISGSHRDFNADFVFSTMNMMAKSEIYSLFDKDEFDVIILDECHRTGANSYRKIMDYFEPKLWLGMTGSPDTRNYDIYSIFDHNIAYEIRLQEALEEDLLCPFHYFGIGDVFINDEDNNYSFSNIELEQRVDYVLEKAEYFGYSGKRVKGLIFCGSKKEAATLSSIINTRFKKDGTLYKTFALTGDDSQEARDIAVNRLESDTGDCLDYILTVDIFNEGVDIPKVNQVILLRPTESPVIFIQQLGRGLRKNSEKEYVVVLDFIGNYEKNFMIPIALSGDRTYNKDHLRRYIYDGNRIIPGSSTIHFDEISKKRIYAAIDKANTSELSLLKDEYAILKNKLGKIPSVMDFEMFGSIDINLYFNKCGSYYHFLKKHEKDYKVNLTKNQEQIIQFISTKLVQFKRIDDLLLLKELIINDGPVNFKEFIRERRLRVVNDLLEASVFRNLTNQFPKDSDKNKYDKCVFVEKKDKGLYGLSAEFSKELVNGVFENMVLELLEFGILSCDENYSELYKDTSFELYKSYNYEDVCRLLNFEQNQNAQNLGGYFYDRKTKTLPVFINYEKAEGAIEYHDRFVSEDHIIASSKRNRRKTSKDVDRIYKKTDFDKDNRIYLFVRKNKDDKIAKEFYFLGEIQAVGEPKEFLHDDPKENLFEIDYRLDDPVRSDIYDYIVKG